MKAMGALLLYGGFTLSLSYGTATPLFHAQLRERGVDFLVNGCFVLFAAPFLVLQPHLAQVVLHGLGLLNTFVVGAVCVGSATLCFTALYLFASARVFLFTALATRFVQGAGSALMLLASYAALPYLFPKHVSRANTLFFASLALGALAAPLCLDWTLRSLGLPGPFWVGGSLVLYGAIVGCAQALPRDSRSLREVQQFDGSAALHSPAVLSLSLNYFLVLFLLSFEVSFLASGGASDPDVQLVAPFAVLQLSAFAVTALLLPALPESHSKTVLLVPCNVLLAVGLSLLSPSPELGDSTVKVVVICGLHLAGIASAVRLGVTPQELIFSSWTLFPGRFKDLLALLGGLRVFLTGLALLLGPMAALLLQPYLGLGHALQVLSILLFVGAFVDIWLLFGSIPPSGPPLRRRQPPPPDELLQQRRLQLALDQRALR